MPGNVAAASPSAVLPAGLASAFRESRQWAARESGPYPDGRHQVAQMATTSRKAWELGRYLTFSEWSTLQAFFDSRKGPLEPFWFYPILTQHDPTGVSATGRWIVRFEGSISRVYRPGRQEVQFRLVQVE
jgi:hypothetical protein